MKALLQTIMLLAVAPLWGQFSGYALRQELKGVQPNTWQRLVLPSAAFERYLPDIHGDFFTPRGKDIRIFGVSERDTIEVPFVWGDSTLTWQSINFNYRSDAKRQTSHLSFLLPNSLKVNELQIEVSPVFKGEREVQLTMCEGFASPNNRCEHPKKLYQGKLMPQLVNTLAFEPVYLHKAELLIDDSGKSPLIISKVRVKSFAYAVYIRFAGDQYTYYLAYGGFGEDPKTYDLPERVPSEVSSEVTLGEKEVLFKIPFAPPTPDESSVSAQIRKRYERRGRGFGALLIWLVIIMIGSLIINAFKALFRKKK